ncbi:DUF4237 domain-containing protein [Empedobacter brevis]|uniref:TNT domain-containing protein n=1 Tax=Empedobacter brevis TaxID=247 RepID=UPI00123C9475|nr:TNT domain-containing protein [Empedobacter brevis]QES92126.1 DUF4237 domain-containing protein [Empedobacter brevis]
MKGFLNGYGGSGSISSPSFSYFDRWDHQVAMGLWQGGADAAIGGAIGKSLGFFKAGVKEIQTTALTGFWPRNSGALGKWETTYLMPGTQIDRYGSGFGRYFSPIDTPIPMRALPPGNTGAYNAYQVIKPFPVQSSTIAPAYGQIGLGTQYLSPVNVNTLLKRGIITPIN